MEIKNEQLNVSKEVAELFSKDIDAKDFSDYIEDQKTRYLNTYHRAIFGKKIAGYGCEHCTQDQQQFLTVIRNRVENLKLIFYSCLLTSELEEIIDNFFDYYIEIAIFFSRNSMGRCHYRHFIGDALNIRAIKINSRLRQKDLELKNLIVREALEVDPIGTQIEIVHMNRVLESMEIERRLVGLEELEYNTDYLKNIQQLETYSLKMGPLLVQQQDKQKKSRKAINEFTTYLIEPNEGLINKVIQLYSNTKPREVCLMLFALYKLSYIRNPCTLNKTVLFGSLQLMLGDIGTRQAFNAALNRISDDFDREQINQHIKQLQE